MTSSLTILFKIATPKPSHLFLLIFFPWNLWSPIMCWNWHTHAHQVNCIHLFPHEGSITTKNGKWYKFRLFSFQRAGLKGLQHPTKQTYVITYFCWFVTWLLKCKCRGDKIFSSVCSLRNLQHLELCLAPYIPVEWLNLILPGAYPLDVPLVSVFMVNSLRFYGM